MKVLQLCHKMPYPPVDGGAQVMHFTSIGLFEKKVDIEILAINPTRQFIDINKLPAEYIENFKLQSVTVDTRLKLIPLLCNLFKSESYFTERFTSAEFNDVLIRTLKSKNFDIIQLEHIYLCKYIRTIRQYSTAKIILRPQNIEYVIWERYNSGVKNPFKKLFLKTNINRLKKFEIDSAKMVDGILALTKDDEDIFKSLAPTIKTTIIPMGYDYNRIKSYDYKEQYKYPISAYHLGSMDWRPNEEAVRWFVQKVAPVLSKHQFKGTIHLAGTHMPDWVYSCNYSFIKVSGQISNSLEFQKDKQIMIVPLLSGSGIRAKIIEGLALGKTIISTTIGAQGINYTNEKDLFIADSPEEFAAKIMSLTESPSICRITGENARKLSESHYNHEIISRSMINFYTACLE